MVKDNIKKIQERIFGVCSRIKVDRDSITIVCVSKGRTREEIKEAVEAGIIDIGENKVQEALAKYNGLGLAACGLRPISWHMVGHLQTNKAKAAVGIFDLIQSVDSLHLAAVIDSQAAKINKIQDILLEVKTSPEATKFGLAPEDTVGAAKAIARLENINIKGLMTIAPLVDNPKNSRPYFKILRELQDKINGLSFSGCQLSVLSMGMTDDYEVAIEEGANMVRLGRAIFEG